MGVSGVSDGCKRWVCVNSVWVWGLWYIVLHTLLWNMNYLGEQSENGDYRKPTKMTDPNILKIPKNVRLRFCRENFSSKQPIADSFFISCNNACESNWHGQSIMMIVKSKLWNSNTPTELSHPPTAHTHPPLTHTSSKKFLMSFLHPPPIHHSHHSHPPPKNSKRRGG